MNDIPRTPNTDQVVEPLHWAAVEGQGGKKPLVSGAGSPYGEDSSPMKKHDQMRFQQFLSLGFVGERKATRRVSPPA